MMITSRSEVAKPEITNMSRPVVRGNKFNNFLYLLEMIVLMAISLATTLVDCSLQFRDNSVHHHDDFLKRSNLVGLALNGYVRDPLLFVAANQLIPGQQAEKSAQSSALYGSGEGITEQGGWNYSIGLVDKNWQQVDDELPPVSFAIGAGVASAKDLLKRKLTKSRHSTAAHYEIPNYPLDQQHDSQKITHIDADLRSCLGPARAQLGCGACYAFSWNSLLEWHYCKQTGTEHELLDLSEQHIIDCSNFGGFDECKAGKIEDAKMFAETFGFYLEREYPYTAKYEKKSLEVCKSQRQGRRFRTFEWKRLIVDRTEWERVLEEQPILVQAHLPSDIMRYKRGIHPANNCNNRMLHGMLLVGHGRDEGKPYWLIRNSMGENWGEGGHFRLARDDTTMSQCFATGWLGKFKFDSLDGDKYEEFYSQIEFEPTEHVLKSQLRKSA